jgi:hypothetical protein
MSRIRMYNDYFPPTKQLSTLALVGYGIFQWSWLPQPEING